MSFQTAPLGLVITAIVAGRPGSGRLRSAAKRPSAASLALSASNRRVRSPKPARLDRLDVELERALRLEQVDPAVGHDPQAGLGLERRALPVVAEPDALELVALVLEREVGMPGGGDRDPPDLAFDPQVRQSRVGADGATDRPGDLADAEDLQARTCRAGRSSPSGAGSPLPTSSRIGDDSHAEEHEHGAGEPGQGPPDARPPEHVAGAIDRRTEERRARRARSSRAPGQPPTDTTAIGSPGSTIWGTSVV